MVKIVLLTIIFALFVPAYVVAEELNQVDQFYFIAQKWAKTICTKPSIDASRCNIDLQNFANLYRQREELRERIQGLSDNQRSRELFWAYMIQRIELGDKISQALVDLKSKYEKDE